MQSGNLGSGSGVLVAAIILSMTSGCGPRINNFEVDLAKPHGADGQIVVSGRRVRGELLEVSDTAFVLRTRDAIVLIPKFAIDESNFRDLDMHRGAELAGEVLEQHRLMSRFPMGMPPEALRSLLRQTGQSELKIITQ
jgi:hypothetical protein